MRIPVPRRCGRGALAAIVAAASLAAGCGSGSAAGPGGSGHGATVSAKSLPSVGTVLTDSKGQTLYMFEPDHRRAVTCTGVCAGNWPPLKLPSGARLSPGPGVKRSLLATDQDPAGGRVVTYNGWPLYTYKADVQPGMATGEGLNLNGGLWYVLRPSGSPVVRSGPGAG